MVAREHVITLRLSSEEFHRFNAVAKDKGLSVSMLLRALVRVEEKENPPNPRQRPQKPRQE